MIMNSSSDLYVFVENIFGCSLSSLIPSPLSAPLNSIYAKPSREVPALPFCSIPPVMLLTF